MEAEEGRHHSQPGQTRGRIVGGCWRPKRVGTTRVERAQGREVQGLPYCAHPKYKAMRRRDQAQRGGGWYSIVNDGPYRSAYEQQLHDYHEGKKRWVAGADRPFRSAFGKRTTAELGAVFAT